MKAGDVEFEARVRIDTPKEAEYFRHGGILQYVLRSLIGVVGPAPARGPVVAVARPSNSRAAAQDRAGPTRHLSIWIGTSGSGPHAGAT